MSVHGKIMCRVRFPYHTNKIMLKCSYFVRHWVSARYPYYIPMYLILLEFIWSPFFFISVVDGVVTRGDDNGSRFQSGRGGYHGDSYRGQGGFRNNGYYNDGGMRNDFRNQDSGRGRGPQGNGYPQNGNGYHQNRNGYHQNGNVNGYPQNGNQQRRPSSNGNGNGNGGKVERSNGPKQQPPVAS